MVILAYYCSLPISLLAFIQLNIPSQIVSIHKLLIGYWNKWSCRKILISMSQAAAYCSFISIREASSSHRPIHIHSISLHFIWFCLCVWACARLFFLLSFKSTSWYTLERMKCIKKSPLQRWWSVQFFRHNLDICRKFWLEQTSTCYISVWTGSFRSIFNHNAYYNVVRFIKITPIKPVQMYWEFFWIIINCYYFIIANFVLFTVIALLILLAIFFLSLSLYYEPPTLFRYKSIKD